MPTKRVHNPSDFKDDSFVWIYLPGWWMLERVRKKKSKRNTLFNNNARASVIQGA